MNLHLLKQRHKDFTRERSSRLLTIIHKLNTEIKLKSPNLYSSTYFSVFVVLIKQDERNRYQRTSQRYPTSPCTDPPPLRKNLLSRRNPNFWTSQSCFFASNWVFVCEHPFNDELMFTTEPTVPSARILSLGSKMYPSDIQRMLDKDFTRFMQSLSRIGQNRVSERKAVLLAGWQNVCEPEDNKEYIISIKRTWSTVENRRPIIL